MPTTRHVSLRKLSDEQALTRASEDYTYAQGEKESDHVECRRFLNIYQAIDAPDTDIDSAVDAIYKEMERDRSNTYMPVGAAIVDSARAQLNDYFFGIPQYFTISSDEPMDFFYEEVVRAHMMKRHKEMKFRSKIDYTFLQMLCFDYAITFMRWHTRPGYESRRITTQKKVPGGIDQRVDVKKVWVPDAVDRSDFVVLHYFDCFHDPDAKNRFEDSRFFADRRWMSIEDLKLQAKTKDQPYGRYKNVEAVVKKLQESTIANASTQTTQDQSEQKRRVEIIRYWTPDQILEYAQDTVINRTNISGWPLQYWGFSRVPGKFRSMGLLQRLERQQYEINASVDDVRDFQNMINDPIAIVRGDIMGIEEGSVRLDRKVYTAADVNDAIKLVQPGIDTTQTALQHTNLQLAIARWVSGFGGENQGGSFTSGRRSATEAGLVEQGAEKRTYLLASLLSAEAFEPALLAQFELEQMNMTKAEAIKYMGEKGLQWRQIDPADYKWDAQPQFQAEGPDYMRFDQITTQQFLQAYQMSIQLPPGLVDIKELTLEMYKRLTPQDAYKFMAEKEPNQMNTNPEDENFMFAKGRNPEVSPANDDAEHIASHSAMKGTTDYQFWPETFRMRLDKHIQAHQAQAAQQMAGAMGGQGGAMGAQGGMAGPQGGGMQLGQDQADLMRGQRVA